MASSPWDMFRGKLAKFKNNVLVVDTEDRNSHL